MTGTPLRGRIPVYRDRVPALRGIPVVAYIRRCLACRRLASSAWASGILGMALVLVATVAGPPAGLLFLIGITGLLMFMRNKIGIKRLISATSVPTIPCLRLSAVDLHPYTSLSFE